MPQLTRADWKNLILIGQVVDSLATYDVLCRGRGTEAEFMGRWSRQAIIDFWYLLKADNPDTRLRSVTALSELRTELEARIRDYGKESVRVADSGSAGCVDRVPDGDSRLYGTT